MSLYKDICIDQIKNASKVIFSKTENLPSEYLEDCINKIKEINPDCQIISEHCSLKDNDWFENLLLLKGEVKKAIVENKDDFQND